jgi:predicted alpha/beta superfamily hydrolase
MPLVARNYRIRSDRRSTALGGSSYGALIALFAYSKYPDVFGRLLIESPSLYVSKAKILDDLKNLKSLPDRVYIGVGTNEEGRSDCTASTTGGDAVADVLRLKKLLQIAGLKSKSLSVAIESCAVHDEEAWARRFPSAITFLFK